MNTFSPSQAPNPLYGVQLGTIRRQKIEGKAFCMVGSPFLMHLGMMISGIISNDHYSAARFSAVQPKVLEETEERLGIKAIFFPLEEELTITQAHRPEIANATMGRVMQAYRVPGLRWHPHAAARTVLLETDFIHGP